MTLETAPETARSAVATEGVAAETPTPSVPADANAHCPGVGSEGAGQADACAGCPNQTFCKTGQASKIIDPAPAEIAERLRDSIGSTYLVLSGKGGVGKSTFTSQLAWALSDSEKPEAVLAANPDMEAETTVAVLDVDICGPSQPRMLGCEGEQVHQSQSGWSPVYVSDTLCVMSVGFMLPRNDEAVIWRGPRKNGLIKQFLRDVAWGPQDFLLVDTPPGTSDEHLSLLTYLKQAGIDGAIVLTTPQDVACQDVRRILTFCRKVGVPIVGIVENMSTFVCPSCHQSSVIFPPTSGGGAALAAEFGVPLLGQIPLDPRIGKACDFGHSFLEEHPESPAAEAYRSIVAKIQEIAAQKAT